MWKLTFVNDALELSDTDKKLMKKFGEPTIEMGGPYYMPARTVSSIVAGVVTTPIAHGRVVGDVVSFSSLVSPTGGIANSTNYTITAATASTFTINTGYGSASGVLTASTAAAFTLPTLLVRIRSDFPYTAEFDSLSAPFIISTQVKVEAYRDIIVDRFNTALVTLRTIADTFTGEKTYTV